MSDFQPLVLKVCSEQENSSALAVKQETVQYICLPVHYAESPLRIVRFKFAIPSLDNSSVLSFPLSSLTRGYGPLRGPTSSSYGGHRPLAKAFSPFGQKKSLLCCFGQFFVIFGVQYRLSQNCVPLSVKLTRKKKLFLGRPVETFVTFSCPFCNFEQTKTKTKTKKKKQKK